MHIRGLLSVGAILLSVAAFAVPDGLFPLAMPVMCGLLALRYRAVYWARNESDARITALVLDGLMGAVFVLSVGAWTVGPALIMTGFVANHIVIFANGFAMPILGTPDLAPGYVRMGPQTRLKWLADIHMTEPGRPHRMLFSLGDAVITVGLWVYVAELALVRWLRT